LFRFAESVVNRFVGFISNNKLLNWVLEFVMRSRR
jgi:hypothetical protein